MFTFPLNLFLAISFSILANSFSKSERGGVNIIFVSSENGKDNNPGTKNSPIASIAEAFSKIKELDKTNSGEIRLYLRGGYYRIDKNLLLKNIKSKLVIEAFSKENVVLSGGVVLQASDFAPLSKSSDSVLFKSDVLDKIYYIDLRKVGVNGDLGTLTDITQNGLRTKRRAELFIDGERATLARWPNRTVVKIDTILRFENKEKREGAEFRFTNQPEKLWKNTGRIRVAGCFSMGWSYEDMEVASVNLQKHIVELSNLSGYGIFSLKDLYPKKQVDSLNHSFFFYNVCEELDSPGEWFLDEQKMRLFVYPKKSLRSDSFELSTSGANELITIDSVANILVKGIKFSTFQGSLLTIFRSRNIIIKDCVFMNSGLNGLNVFRSSKILVKNSMFKNIGAIGAILSGGDRVNLTPGNNRLENCEFSNCAQTYRSYSPAVQINGVGNVVKNCYFHDSPGQAVIFNGNDHLIANNSFVRFCSEFNDIGCIYTGRDPSSTGTVIGNNYFEDIHGKLGSKMIAAVYVDDGSGGMSVVNNLFFRCGPGTPSEGFGAIHINGGGANNLNWNVFVSCNLAVSMTDWSNEMWSNMYEKNLNNRTAVLSTVEKNKKLYLERYPWLKSILSGHFVFPEINTVNNCGVCNVSRFAVGKGVKIINTFVFDCIAKPDKVVNYAKWLPASFSRGESGWKPIMFSEIGIKRGK